LNNLIIDIEDSRIKAATFEEFSLADGFTCNREEELVTIINQLSFDKAFISLVKVNFDEIKATFLFRFDYYATRNNPPSKNIDASPKTFGLIGLRLTEMFAVLGIRTESCLKSRVY